MAWARVEGLRDVEAARVLEQATVADEWLVENRGTNLIYAGPRDLKRYLWLLDGMEAVREIVSDLRAFYAFLRDRSLLPCWAAEEALNGIAGEAGR